MGYIEKTDREELAMMRDPERWPHYDILPVKRYKKGMGTFSTGGPECGVLRSGRGPVVYKGNPWQREALETAPVIAEYKTFEEMYADGWVVD